MYFAPLLLLLAFPASSSLPLFPSPELQRHLRALLLSHCLLLLLLVVFTERFSRAFSIQTTDPHAIDFETCTPGPVMKIVVGTENTITKRVG